MSSQRSGAAEAVDLKAIARGLSFPYRLSALARRGVAELQVLGVVAKVEQHAGCDIEMVEADVLPVGSVLWPAQKRDAGGSKSERKVRIGAAADLHGRKVRLGKLRVCTKRQGPDPAPGGCSPNSRPPRTTPAAASRDPVRPLSFDWIARTVHLPFASPPAGGSPREAARWPVPPEPANPGPCQPSSAGPRGARHHWGGRHVGSRPGPRSGSWG